MGWWVFKKSILIYSRYGEMLTFADKVGGVQNYADVIYGWSFIEKTENVVSLQKKANR